MKQCNLTSDFKNVAIGLCIILLLFAGWSIWKSIDYSQKKATFEKDKALREERIAGLEEAAMGFYTRAKLFEDVAGKQHQKIIALEGALEANAAELEKIVAEVKKMKPGEVVQETQRILEMDDHHVWLTKKGIQFSMDASKKNLGILREWEFNLKVRIPALFEVVQEQQVEIFLLRMGLASCSKAYETKIKINEELKAQILADEEMMKTMEKQIKITRLKTFGGTFIGTAIVVGGLILILK